MRKTTIGAFCFVVAIAPAATGNAQSNIDPAHKFAWQENCGWLNWRHGAPMPGDGVRVTDTYLAGFVWAENVGWINLDDATHFIALGPVCAPGDVACDGVITLFDYATFGEVFMGPDVPADCPTFDSDGDSDVDLKDFANLQAGFTD